MPSPQFIGLNTHYRTADGESQARIHMDGAASPLASKVALQTIQELLPHYSNTHSYVHNSAQISTKALGWAYSQILKCLGANESDYTAIFTGAGTTAGINRIARGLAVARPERKIVLVSAMEHHANDLPHRQFGNQIHYIPLANYGDQQGRIDLREAEALLIKYQGQVNYLAFSHISNVTGIVNPSLEIARLAHKYDTLVLVDGAQSVAHCATHLSHGNAASEIDMFVFSGHKLYTPTAPGVLVAKKQLLASLTGQDLGGGSVADVSYYDYQLLTEFPHKEQSGTTNIVGAIALAKVMHSLDEYGFEKIEHHAKELGIELFDALSSLSFIQVYGDSSQHRIGAISFNHTGIDHGLLAAILNDYYAIAVRNGCFCAHPYVSSMLKEALWQMDLSDVAEDQHEMLINAKRGMVRVSISLYNTSADIEALVRALNEISHNIEKYQEHYQPQQDGSYRHKTFKIDWLEQLGWQA
ncbi:MAG: cysteine desulfurase/selenocysteine lyase [Dinoroseobacter sp.]|jgi:cysteine desulfurase/selenocysteine lyase